MSDVGVFPTLAGLGWSVTKAPTFQTRIQRAVSGRELRALDYPFPLWQFTLVYDFLRDNLSAGFNELRTLMGFYLSCQGAFGTFLFQDPTDNQVTGQVLPLAISTITGVTIANAGSGYSVSQVVAVIGGVGSQGAAFSVTSVNGSGGITGLSFVNPGAYTVIPGSSGVALIGSGATVNLTWLTTVQLVRTFGGFTEPILAPNTLNKVYYNGVAQTGVGLNTSNGVVTLVAPFTSTQPTITADFTYYFRCRFVDDSYQFENFMFQLWTLKKLTFISVRP